MRSKTLALIESLSSAASGGLCPVAKCANKLAQAAPAFAHTPTMTEAQQAAHQSFLAAGTLLHHVEVRAKRAAAGTDDLRDGHLQQSLGTLRRSPAAVTDSAEGCRGMGRRHQHVVDSHHPGAQPNRERL